MSDDFLRLSVTEAAIRLGVSVDTVRRRIKAQDVRAQRDNAGKWWVYVPADAPPPERPPPGVVSGETLGSLAARPPVAPPAPTEPPQDARDRRDLIDRLMLENDRLWDSLKSKDNLIRELVLRLAAAGSALQLAERNERQRDEARDQLRQLKALVGQMLSKIETHRRDESP